MNFFSTKVTCPCLRCASVLINRSRSESSPRAPLAAASNATAHNNSRLLAIAPEIEEVEPIVGVVAQVLLQELRIPLDRNLHLCLALPWLGLGKIGKRLERDV